MLHNHYSKIVSQDLLIKNICKNSTYIPKFIKVSVSAKLNLDYKGAVLSLLEVLTFNKPFLTQSQVNSLTLNLKKGQVAGVKITLRKNHIYDFLDRFLLEILPYSKTPKFALNKKKYAHFQFKEISSLEETDMLHTYFQNLNGLDVVVESSTACVNIFSGCRISSKNLDK